MIAYIEIQLADDEIDVFLSRLRSGLNPFRDGANNPVDPNHQTRNVAIKRVLKRIGNLDPEDALQYKFAFGALSNLTQPQVEALGFVWTQYQAWLANVQVLRDTAIANVKLGGN